MIETVLRLALTLAVTAVSLAMRLAFALAMLGVHLLGAILPLIGRGIARLWSGSRRHVRSDSLRTTFNLAPRPKAAKHDARGFTPRPLRRRPRR